MDGDDEEPAGAMPTPEGVPDFCGYAGCENDAKRTGLCVKHLVALARKDAEAARAAGEWHAVHDPAPKTEAMATSQWRHCPKAAEAEKRKESGETPLPPAEAAKDAAHLTPGDDTGG